MLPTEYLMLTYIIHIDEKGAFNFVISTNISIFIVLTQVSDLDFKPFEHTL